MGFPLHQGDVRDGILDCHWHHARFDISCGATLDPWADDVDAYRVELRDGDVFVDSERPRRDPAEHGLQRIRRGLDENLRLVLAKATISMEAADVDASVAIAAGARFGAKEHRAGWLSGTTILSCMANVLDVMAPDDRTRALTKALAWIAEECQGQPPRRPLPGLDGTQRDAAGLRRWLRETVEVRDADGTERILRALVEQHGSDAALDAVLAACTDHRYCDAGHTLDFTLKCAELAERLPEDAPLLFTALAPQLVQMQRMEETSAWRRPVDVAALVAAGAERIPAEFGKALLADEDALVKGMLDADPARTVDEILGQLEDGVSPVALADAVVLASIRRILRFGTVNEVPDWETVHHTYSYANAVAEGLRRVPSRELFRGVLDGAMSVYLDRFLNVPPAKMPAPSDADLLALYDQRASVDEAAAAAAGFAGEEWDLFRTLAHAVLREDAGFHDYQQVDLMARLLQRRGGTDEAKLGLIATARWLAARYPTRRAQEQTYSIAWRLHRGDALHEIE
ncbi:MAG: Rieske (2Fe-2S) protein [Planctomycetota bacterium]|nr:Rieske (2Fe-2S) protein [Planctomycetota bacterium]